MQKIYLDYCRELDHYFPEDKRESSDEKYIIGFNSYISDPFVTFYPIQGKEVLCGFSIHKDGKVLNINGYDYENVEMYIKPFKRHRGLAFKAAVEDLGKNKGNTFW